VKLDYLKLKFTSPLHLGTNRPGFESTDEILHSDTLFSAIINIWARLYPEDIGTFFPESSGESLDFPWFQLSSAFPYCDKSLYFPKPFKKLNTGDEDNHRDPKIAKKIKKLKYLDQKLFEKALNDEFITTEDDQFSGNGMFLNASPITEMNPFATYDVPRVIKDRKSGVTTPFNFSRICFDEKAGLWFAAKFSDEKWKQRFRAVLNLLGDTGIGGDRSVGHGQFEVIQADILELNVPTDSQYCLNLSLYHPKAEEIPAIPEEASYQLIERKGWVFSGTSKPLRRQSVRMFREGSVLGNAEYCRGDLVKVLDKNNAQDLDHHIYRYGIAFTIPCRKGGEHNE